jgi:homoserine O-acetyltransferase
MRTIFFTHGNRPRVTIPSPAVLCINAADDERNPPETGVTAAALKRINNAQLLLIPASEETRGHGTTAQAKFYAKELRGFLDAVPKRAM